MIPLTLAQIASALGGRLQGDAAATATSVTIDSRTVVPGALFVALSGERTDGSRFVEDALSAGAVAALTSVDGPGDRILAEDTQAALQALGAHVRASSKALVVAITGSNGKTLTKDLTAAALSSERSVIASRASFNNEIGVPLTLCEIETGTEAVVAEVGSRGPGHIAALGPLLAPDVAVVLNVGEAHLGLFGDLETTARAKAELVQALRTGGTAVLNADDSRTRAMAGLAEQVVTFGASADANFRLVSVGLDEDARATLEVAHPDGKLDVALPLAGEHLASNALAALAVAWVAGVDLERAAAAIEAADTSPGRTRLVHLDRRVILDDAYNANPGSMRAALKTLAHLGAKRPTWAVLGEMAELGASSVEAHDAIGRLATRLGIEHVVTVGTGAEPIARAAILEGMSPDDVRAVGSVDEALAVLREHAEPEAAILVKASRAAGLDEVVSRLLEEASPA